MGSNEELESLKEQFKEVKAAIDATSKISKERSENLDDKERRLKNYQFKIQQKQNFLDEMATIIRALNMTAPDTSIDAEPEAFVWDDEEKADDDYYVEYYTGDDDWMSDEEWY